MMIIRSISTIMFALLALVVMSFPAHASAMSVAESCMACMTTAEMPPGAVSALSGTEDIGKVAISSGRNSINNIHSPGFIKHMAEGGGGWISTDALVAVTENSKTMYAVHQNLILDNRLQI